MRSQQQALSQIEDSVDQMANTQMKKTQIDTRGWYKTRRNTFKVQRGRSQEKSWAWT